METMRMRGPALGVAEIYERSLRMESGWIARNAFVINSAIDSGLAICGSVGVGVATGHPTRIPGDLDFVTANTSDAYVFIEKLDRFLSDRSVHYGIRVNHNTKFCPAFVGSHYRIKCPLWMEICVFVLKDIEVDFFFKRGVRVQNYRQMYDAAKGLDKRDGRDRMSNVIIDSETTEEDPLEDIWFPTVKFKKQYN